MGVLILLIMCLANIFCFLIGAKVGQQAAKGEQIGLPKVNPLEHYRQHQEKQEHKREQERWDTILRNIESYDGTGYGQEEVPRG